MSKQQPEQGFAHDFKQGLAGSGHHARKRFGQNFLHDQRVIEKIVNAVAPKAGDFLVEIGPGLGAVLIAGLGFLLLRGLLNIPAPVLVRRALS